MTRVENDYDQEYIAFEQSLEKAVIKYAESLDVDQLRQYVIDDLWDYYTGAADAEEAWMFIDELGDERAANTT